jgi:cyclophilin family peptidyl-prolyl cis-trans isomerase
MRTFLIGFALTAAVFAQTATSPTTSSTTQSTKSKTTPAKSKSTTAKSKTSTTPTKAATTTAATTKPASAAHPIAVFDTSKGKIACELFPDKAPKTVANFIGLAKGTKDWKHPYSGQNMKGTPLYDNTTFHRVIPNFMIQGGDPIGNGTGDPGYRFEDEFSPDLRFDVPGRLAMANSGPNTNGSQFFITEVPTPHLNDRHTIFGQCDQASVDLVNKIARVATDPRNNRPLEPVTLNHIEIVGDEAPVAKPAAAPAKTPAKAKSKAKSTTKAKSKSATSNSAAQQPK